MIYHLKPLIGLNELSFGMLPADISTHFGEPEEIEEIEDELLNDHVLVYHYWDAGISFFFSMRRNNIFTGIEIDSHETVLFGESIFSLNEKQIIELFKKHGLLLSDKEQHEWGEKRISFDAINMDLYFSSGKLYLR